MRTLKYADIKAGIRKAGPVPAWGCEEVMLLAWLAAAGYGRACKPSLELYQRFVASCKGKYRFPGRRRRRSRSMSSQEPSKATQEGAAISLGIAFPGKIQNPRKHAQHEKRDALGYSFKVERNRFLRDGLQSESLAERRKSFVDAGGFYVAAALKAYGGRPSLSRVISVVRDHKAGFPGKVVTLQIVSDRDVLFFCLPTLTSHAEPKDSTYRVNNQGNFVRPPMGI